jgi:hypothetical protein
VATSASNVSGSAPNSATDGLPRYLRGSRSPRISAFEVGKESAKKRPKGARRCFEKS